MLVASYFLVSSSAVLLYDYLLTFRLEVDYIWLSSYNWLTVVYFFQRYLPFVDTLGLFLYGIFFPALSSQNCNVINQFCHWFWVIGITLSEIVLIARAYAVCRIRFNSRKLLAALTIIVALFSVPPVYMTSETHSKSKNVGPDGAFASKFGETLPSNTCIIHAPPSLLLKYVCRGAHETVILALIIIAAYPIYKEQGHSQLFRVVYSEGIMYNVILIFVIATNAIMLLTAQTDFTLLLLPLTRVVHATLASRTVLHIREVVSRRTSGIDIGSYNEMDLDDSELPMIRSSSQSTSTGS
ncbi:hypothetical protein L218DRAFT_895312 [Marasmius fiardii PR-910]|nr:hypothetical protein L218DRAFT_895312 [Marasmius fiardii PR-910]